MILNICDRRKRPFRWMRVDAIVEPTWHDNRCKDSDQAPKNESEISYDERNGISLSDAIKWAENIGISVTLYIYDEGGNTSVKLNELPTDHPIWKIQE
jgi:hypothetical protein